MIPEKTPFIGFPKIARYNRQVVVTEKLDGTNAQVYISDDGKEILAGSRNRWITPADDNYGFATWVEANRDDLLKLGPGAHFGEWWGAGIQRRYGLTEKRFSLFNVGRWADPTARPSCCHVVPELWRGSLEELNIREVLKTLAECGSVAAPGFFKPEGVVIYHVASKGLFKKTLDNDHLAKGEQ